MLTVQNSSSWKTPTSTPKVRIFGASYLEHGQDLTHSQSSGEQTAHMIDAHTDYLGSIERHLEKLPVQLYIPDVW